jgi:hypothetical protein
MTMARGVERQRREPRKPEGALLEAIAYLNGLMSKWKWSPSRMHETYFKGIVDRGTLRGYLKGPQPNGSRKRTVDAILKRTWEIRAKQTREYKLYHSFSRSLERELPSDADFERYRGDYRFWRPSRYGLVEGRVSIYKHELAGTPHHRHKHTQVIDPRTGEEQTFEYEGGVYWQARNILLISIAKGEVRSTQFRRVNDPREAPLVGILQSEERDGSGNPFAARVLLCHEDWCAGNESLLTEKWLRNRLRNGAREQGILRVERPSSARRTTRGSGAAARARPKTR